MFYYVTQDFRFYRQTPTAINKRCWLLASQMRVTIPHKWLTRDLRKQFWCVPVTSAPNRFDQILPDFGCMDWVLLLHDDGWAYGVQFSATRLWIRLSIESGSFHIELVGYYNVVARSTNRSDMVKYPMRMVDSTRLTLASWDLLCCLILLI